MSVPDDAKTVRGLLDRCQEAMQLTGDTETVKRLEDYAEELRQQLRRLERGDLNSGR